MTLRKTPHINTLIMDWAQLKEENSQLKRELAYIHKLQSVSRKLLGDVRSVSERLREAVLNFRRDQKTIDYEFQEAMQCYSRSIPSETSSASAYDK
jgi:septation ring formation regulator EzrA